jgi:hypothetical protein
VEIRNLQEELGLSADQVKRSRNSGKDKSQLGQLGMSSKLEDKLSGLIARNQREEQILLRANGGSSAAPSTSRGP